MASHNLLLAVFTASCVALPTGSQDNTTPQTYPARVFNTTQGECPSDAQREMVIAEVKEGIHNLLPLFLPIRKWMHLMCKLPNTDSTVVSPQIRPPPPRNSYTVRFKASAVKEQRKNEASIHRTAKLFIASLFKLSNVKVSSASAVHPQQRWTMQAIYFAEAPCFLAPQR